MRQVVGKSKESRFYFDLKSNPFLIFLTELFIIGDSLRSKPDDPLFPLEVYGFRDPDGYNQPLDCKIHDAIKQGEYIVGLLGKVEGREVLIPYVNSFGRFVKMGPNSNAKVLVTEMDPVFGRYYNLIDWTRSNIVRAK